MNELLYNSWLEIKLDYISHNINQMRTIIDSNCDIMCIVKSNAYGHGAIEVSRHLIDNCNIPYLGVANIFEALELRNAEIQTPILVLGTITEPQLEAAIKNNITITLFDIGTARKVVELSIKHNIIPKVHIKIDTGLRRIGLRPGEELEYFLEQIKDMKELNIEGVFTHLADSGNIDKSFTKEQLISFNKGLKQLSERNINPRYIHCAASQAILEVPDSHFNLVRAGKVTYGYHGMDHECQNVDLKPVLSWKAVIQNIKKLYAGESIGYSRTFMAEKDMLIAVIGVGFSDGFSSLLSNKGSVIIGGKIVPIVGRVCMDSCFADISDLENIKVGDVVTLLGEENGIKIDKSDFTKITGFQISEVIANIGRRVGRFYI